MDEIGTLIFFLVSVLALAGTILGVAGMRHRERMAGVRAPRGKAGRRGDVALTDTVRLLTETLERQHERLQTLERRLAAVERPAASTTPALALPDDEEATPVEAATEPVRARVRV